MLDKTESVLGSVKVMATSGRGASIAEVADRALSRIIHVGENAHPLIRDQALAYKEQIRPVLEYYMSEAIKGHNTTVANKLRSNGCSELIPIIMEIE